MRTIEQIREDGKKLRDGFAIQGLSYTKSADGVETIYEEESQKTYKISGLFRIKVEEYNPNAPVPQEVLVKPAKEPRVPREKKLKLKDYKLEYEGANPEHSVTFQAWFTERYPGLATEHPTWVRTKKPQKSAHPRDENGRLITRETAICSKCGKEFIRSIFNPYQTECPECRPAKAGGSRANAEARHLVCGVCGQDFVISKYQPYYTAEQGCPECRRKAKNEKKAAKRKAKVAETTQSA